MSTSARQYPLEDSFPLKNAIQTCSGCKGGILIAEEVGIVVKSVSFEIRQNHVNLEKLPKLWVCFLCLLYTSDAADDRYVV